MGSLAVWSSVVLWISVGLQVALPALLVRRRLASEPRVFAVLLCFYATRSAVLYTSAHLLPRGAYALYNSLSLVDLLLQIALAGELIVLAVRSVPGRWLVAFASAASAARLTAWLVTQLPPRSPVPADRGTIFAGILFLLLSGFVVRGRLEGWPRAAGTGLALAGVAGTLSECGKSYAAFHRNGHVYVAWSYGNAACYLAILGYWMMASVRSGKAGAGVREAAAAHARGSIGVDRLEA